MFGSAIPDHFSRNCRTDVWSKTWEHTLPPRLHGETTSIGTRVPSPIGSPFTSSSATPGVD